MDISTEVDHMKDDDVDLISTYNHEKDKTTEFIPHQNFNKSSISLKCSTTKKQRDNEKQRSVTFSGNRSTYQRKYFKPPAVKKKSAPTISLRMSNPSAEVVLRERKVEIKDLESQVVYLQSQIKELKAENRTLVDLQNRQEKELRKFKEGVADIPSLLRSHKDELKAVESSACSLRRELRDCQKELKVKSDIILRKDQHLDKLHLTLKRNEKNLQEHCTKNKELKTENKRLEDESKKLLVENEELKSKNERNQRKIQQMTSKVLNLEETLGTSEHHEALLKEELSKLQKKLDETVENENPIKNSVQILKLTSGTQTDSCETVNASCMAIDTAVESPEVISQQVSIGVQVYEEDAMFLKSGEPHVMEAANSVENILVDEVKSCQLTTSKEYNTAIEAFSFIYQNSEPTLDKPTTRVRKAMYHKPLYPAASFSSDRLRESSSFIAPKDYIDMNSFSPSKNYQFLTKDASKKTAKKPNKLRDSSLERNFKETVVVTKKGIQSDCKPRTIDFNNSGAYFKHNRNQNNSFSSFTVKQNSDILDWLDST
ncbi:lebercilin domain-containing protein [Caerostris darwini]|uniref:Lebercilin domain-containing protein n=1 Tax=Caerostris darwini TaxID=1538125 RepID=A0AAV4SK01_9ARAC|nr:lebercilin domain-containing protein [Caerostris darwini]